MSPFGPVGKSTTDADRYGRLPTTPARPVNFDEYLTSAEPGVTLLVKVTLAHTVSVYENCFELADVYVIIILLGFALPSAAVKSDADKVDECTDSGLFMAVTVPMALSKVKPMTSF